MRESRRRLSFVVDSFVVKVFFVRAIYSMDNSVKDHAFTVRIDSSLLIFIKGPYAIFIKGPNANFVLVRIPQLFKRDFL